MQIPSLSLLGPFGAFFSSVGSFVVLVLVATTLYYFCKNFYVFFLAERLGHTVDFKSLGKWAVVTGATDGIGKGYALDLARRGCNVVLISRSEEKLMATAREVEAHKVQTRTIAVDFGGDETIYDKIKSQLDDLEIGILINNVGMIYEYPDFLHLVSGGEEALIKIIRVNCIAQTRMTQIVLPQMVKRRKGVIVHLSSGAGSFPTPLLAVYSATKAFNDFLGRAIAQEYQDQGIISQVIMPFVVATNMSGIAKSNIFALDSKAYARSCLNSVGFLSRTNGHPSHAIQNWIAMRIPHILSSKMYLWTMKKWRDMMHAQKKGKSM